MALNYDGITSVFNSDWYRKLLERYYDNLSEDSPLLRYFRNINCELDDFDIVLNFRREENHESTR